LEVDARLLDLARACTLRLPSAGRKHDATTQE